MNKSYILPVTVIVAFFGGLLVGNLVGPFFTHAAVDSDKTLEQSKKAAESNHLTHAYDLWLIAANAEAGNANLVPTAAVILKRSAESQSSEAAFVQASLKERLPLLIPFQRPDDVEAFRSKIEPLLTPPTNDPSPLTLEARLELLKKEKDMNVAKGKALELREEVEQLLEESTPDEETTRASLRQFIVDLDKVELSILDKQFKNLQPLISDWHTKRNQLENKVAAALYNATGELSTPMTQHVQKGIELIDQIAPFVAGGVKEATSELNSITNSCERLRKAAEWVYNQEALIVLHQVRDNRPMDAIFRANKLITVDPGRLNSVVMGRYNQEYHYLFNELLAGDEERALDLMKLMTIEALKLP